MKVIERSRRAPTGLVVMALALGLLVAVAVSRSVRIEPANRGLGRQAPPSGDYVPVLGQVEISICDLQGAGFTSPHLDRAVVTRGVVTGDFDQTDQKGFFMQAEGCDQDPSTSDGIFVSMGVRVQAVDAGDLVEVSGVVREHFGRTEVQASLESVLKLGQGLPLPAAAELAPPFDDAQARQYFEALEGMRVAVAAGRVVGPTSRFGETWFVRDDLGIERVFHDDPAGTGVVITADSAGLYAVQPPAKVGDRLTGLEGVLGFVLGAYRVHLTQPALIEPAEGSIGTPAAPRGAGSGAPVLFEFSLATLNLHNLFDTLDDPGKDDPLPSATTYQRQLGKLALTVHDALGEPELLAVQEAENESVLEDLLARPEVQADYGILLVEGPDIRGIDVALLYRRDRVVLLDHAQHQGCTVLVDGLGPDGNRDMQNPQNRVTCDADGDGLLDGNRLFSRPPLVARLWVCPSSCLLEASSQSLPPEEVWLIVNHWKSKSQDTEWSAHTLPRRIEQAEFVAALAGHIQTAHPGVSLVIAGDLNDTPGSPPLETLAAAGLYNLTRRLPRPVRYTFIFRGVSQTLDHVLFSPAWMEDWIQVEAVHLNADYPGVLADAGGVPYRASDHDPVLVQVTLLPHKVYLPFSPLADTAPAWKERNDEAQ